jgi:hypothetical protein
MRVIYIWGVLLFGDSPNCTGNFSFVWMIMRDAEIESFRPEFLQVNIRKIAGQIQETSNSVRQRAPRS